MEPGGGSGPRRPLVGLGLLVAAGTLAGLRYPAGADFLLPAALVLLGAGLLFRRSPAGGACLLAAWAAAGWIAAGLDAGGASARDLGRLLDQPRERVGLTGAIDDEPRRSSDGSWLFAVRVEGVRRAGYWQRARGTVLVRAPSSAARPYRFADRWSWNGVLDLRERARFNAEAAGALFLGQRRGGRLRAWCFRRRAASARLLGKGLEGYPIEAGLLRALLLGYRADLDPGLRDLFSTTGTLHIFAISGLHVGIAAVLLTVLLNALGLPRTRWILVLGPFLVLYTLATGSKASAVRACLMALCFWGAPLLRRRPDIPSALAAAGLLILVASPSQAATPGFLLSFVVVAGLLVYGPPLARLVRAEPAADSWGIDGEERPARRRWALLRRSAGGLLCLSAAAWLASAPLTARFFNLFSPAALVGNLFVVPAAFLIVFTGALSLLGGALVPVWAELCNHANRWFIAGLVEAIRWLREIPCGHAVVRSPGWPAVFLWYGGAAALLRGRRLLRAAGASALLLALVLATGWPQGRSRMEVVVLALSRGAAALADLPGPAALLVDTGPAHESRALLSLLRRRGVNRLDALVLTQANADHAGGAPEVLRSVPVAEVWCVPDTGRSRAYRETLELAGRMKIPVRFMAAGDRGTFPGGVFWEVLHPPPGSVFTRADEGSLVFRLARDGSSALFMGGAGEAVEKRLLASSRELAASVLLAGRPGQGPLCGEDWLEAVAPERVVLHGERLGRTEGPQEAAAERLRRRGLSVWRLDRDGTLVLRFEPLRRVARGYPPVVSLAQQDGSDPF